MTVGVKDNAADDLLACWRAGLEAADPATAVRRALDALPEPPQAPWIVAIGKAAGTMAGAAAAWLHGRGDTMAGALVVAPEPPPGALRFLPGDHPLPGPNSVAAALALDAYCRGLPEGAPVWLLLSGGATSLAASPEPDLTLDDLRTSFEVLLASGWDIRRMNQVRKRLSRWGGGKLRRALGQRPTVQLIVSDVLDDDLAAIGSGPLVPDSVPATEVLAALENERLLGRLPSAAAERLRRTAAGEIEDILLADDTRPPAVISRIVVSNRVAARAAAEAGRRKGWEVVRVDAPLTGAATACGETLVRQAVALPGRGPVLLVAGGEPTVRLGPGPTGSGGRCQELVLAAARALREVPDRVVVVAAGTDGRDGPTDAAGAVADNGTWRAIADAGVDPDAALARHDSYRALEAAGALVRTGPTGTNVADLVLLLRVGDPERETSGAQAAR